MLRIIICLALALSTLTSVAQEPITPTPNYKEAIKLKNSKPNIKSFNIHVKPEDRGEFAKDPLSFLKNQFNMMKIIPKLGVKNTAIYLVNIKSTKGDLRAEFDDKGNILMSSYKFKDVFLPENLRRMLYRDYKGWNMISNVRIAQESNGIIKKDYYLITMKKGRKKIKLRIKSSDLIKTT